MNHSKLPIIKSISDQVIREIFLSSLLQFLKSESHEILKGVNERNNCARWATYLEQAAREKGLGEDYVADAEYNRKQNGSIKTILDNEAKVVTINCDLILHSRGKNIIQDNLIAIEVKKSSQQSKHKQSDRERLRALTKASYDGIWMNDGSVPPEHVCGYRLGVFVELNRRRKCCTVEYYKDGAFESSSDYNF